MCGIGKIATSNAASLEFNFHTEPQRVRRGRYTFGPLFFATWVLLGSVQMILFCGSDLNSEEIYLNLVLGQCTLDTEIFLSIGKELFPLYQSDHG